MTAGAPDPRITWIVEYIQRHLAEPITAGGLAARIDLSASRFSALFTAQTGVAPMRFVRRARLHRARLLLERTFLSVKEVMALVGYNDPCRFARDFNREHGAPPTEFTSSLDRPIHRRIGPPRARDPGWAHADRGRARHGDAPPRGRQSR